MTQQELDQICTDICEHGRQVQGWSCDRTGAGRIVLTDHKRGHSWARGTAGAPWVEVELRAQ